MKVTKRNGSTEDFCKDKITDVLEWACQGLDGVTPATVLVQAKLHFTDGMETSAIHEALIKASSDLISETQPAYQYVAGRLLMTKLRKIAFGEHTPPDFREHIKEMILLGKYDPYIWTGTAGYSKEEMDELGGYIDHDRDLNFTYGAMSQWESKYLVQDRVTKVVFESPQQAVMLIGMCLFGTYKNLYSAQTRIDYCKKFYDAVSTFKISLPTPIMGGVRTPTKQFSSCVLIENGDSLDSINGTSNAIVKYISQRAGIGINAGRIRALGSPIRSGEAFHTGSIPFYKHFQTAVKSCSQGGIRGGAATLFYPWWHKDVESFIVLKNNKGTEDNRVRHLDYSIQLNKFFYQKVLKNESVNLFCPNEAEGLYESFAEDQEVFEELYNKYSEDATISRKTIKAKQLLMDVMQERAGTGRVYIQNIDHCNVAGPFDSTVAPVRQSNLCVAPETQILTKEGYIPIAELEGESVDVWNGEEWSPVDVVKTSEEAKLLKVSTTSGYELECTPEHKFYVHTGYGLPYKEVRTKDLKSGDKLMKFDLPVVLGDKDLENSYINGFYTGDGCMTRQGQRVYLYNEKRALKPWIIGGGKWTVQEEYNREYCHFSNLRDKYFVPDASFSVESRLKWLAGWLDADGCVYRNGTNEALTGSSVEKGFLREVQLMLQTLGVSCKVMHNQLAGVKKMPANDGTGESKDFECKDGYRLLISSYDSFKLLELGLELNRLVIAKRIPQRDAKQFVKVASVEDLGRVDKTYCFTEHKRNLGMFNGLLTGQCLEIALPTAPLTTENPAEGEIALCTLAAFNLGEVDNLSEFSALSDIIVRALDSLLDYQGYPSKAAEKALERRALGVGVINYAYFLAKNGVKYSDGSANNLTHEWFEAMQYNLLKASNNLAKEQGACKKFNHTKYAKGMCPLDWYNKNTDELHTALYKCDWESLRISIETHGLRNSTLTALMPAETSAIISNATNGIEPPRGLVVTKGGKNSPFKVIVPEVQELFDSYELLWDIPSNRGYIELVAIMQKFVDQSISANTNYNPFKYQGNLVPMKELMQDVLTAYKLGVKTLYYHNTYDGSGIEQEEDDGCAGGACKL